MELQDIFKLRDTDLPQRARGDFDEAHGRVQAAQQAVADAEQAVAAARDARSALVQRAGSGEAVEAAALAEAEMAIRDAGDRVLFCRDAVAAAEATKRAADEALRTAEQRAWEPVLAAGIQLRIEGAEMIVQAKKLLADGEAVFRVGLEAVGRAIAAGVDLKLGFQPSANPEIFAGVLRPEHPFPDAERRTWAAHLDERGDVILPESARKLLEATE